MTLVDVGEGVLRAFGILYVVGAGFTLWALRLDFFLDKALAQLELALAGGDGEPPPPSDPGRKWWLAAGGVLTFAAGATMALGLRLAVPALVLLMLHQIAYLLRQRRLELKASTPAAAEDARPTQATRNGFYSCVAQTILAAWLGWAGALS